MNYITIDFIFSVLFENFEPDRLLRLVNVVQLVMSSICLFFEIVFLCVCLNHCSMSLL